MSFHASNWAYSLPIKRSATKSVLVALAFRADDEGTCFPSIPAICDMTSLARNTVIDALETLRGMGVIQVVGRKGKTRQVRVYRLCGMHLPNIAPDSCENATLSNGVDSETVSFSSAKSGENATRNRQESSSNNPSSMQAHDLGGSFDQPDVAGAPVGADDLFGASAPAPAAKRRITFNGEAFDNITAEQVAAWRDAYPALNVEQELKRAALWLVANPKNTKTNYARFLISWLARSQDRAPARGGGVRPGQYQRSYQNSRASLPHTGFADKDYGEGGKF